MLYRNWSHTSTPFRTTDFYFIRNNDNYFGYQIILYIRIFRKHCCMTEPRYFSLVLDNHHVVIDPKEHVGIFNSHYAIAFTMTRPVAQRRDDYQYPWSALVFHNGGCYVSKAVPRRGRSLAECWGIWTSA